MMSNRSLARTCAAIATAVFLSGSLIAIAQPAGQPGAPGAQGVAGGRGGMRVQLAQPGTAFHNYINVLGDCNLRPDFTLTAEQKVKLQEIRDSFKAAETEWRDKNAESIKKIDEQLAELGRNNDREAMRDLMEERRELYATAPNGEAQVEQAKALLNADQTQVVETRHEELRKEREQNAGAFGGGGGGGRRGGNNQPRP